MSPHIIVLADTGDRALSERLTPADHESEHFNQQLVERDDYRWVAEVVNHLVFARPDNIEAKELQARALEQFAYGAENGTWRNFSLIGAHELSNGVAGTATITPARLRRQPHQRAAIQCARDPDRRSARGDRRITMHWRFTDTGEEHTLTLQHGVLGHRRGASTADADAIDGDRTKLGELLGLLDAPDPNFADCHPMIDGPAATRGTNDSRPSASRVGLGAWTAGLDRTAGAHRDRCAVDRSSASAAGPPRLAGTCPGRSLRAGSALSDELGSTKAAGVHRLARRRAAERPERAD